MSAAPLLPNPPKVIYPEGDGEPIADNTLQFQWIVTIEGNLDVLFAGVPNVFVAGDLLWYPVEGNNTICQAPDALVAFGRPKGRRGSYRQWDEDGIAPQVVFEVLSPGNRFGAMLRKFQFYERYGVVEYYVYDPDRNELEGWRRQGEQLIEITHMTGWTSPLLGIRFGLETQTLRIYYPDGRPFLTFVELAQQREQAQRQVERQVERLAAQLRAHGIEPEA